MKKILVATAVLGLFAPVLVLAAFDDVTLTTDTVLTVDGITLNVSGSSATIESITVDSGNFSVTLLSGSVFQVTAPGLEQLSASTLTGVTSDICNTNQSLLKYQPSSTVTVTITPSTTLCSSTGGGSSGGGGSSSSSSSSSSSATPATPATPAVPGNEIPGCGNRTTGFSTSSGLSCVGNTPTTPATPATPATPGASASTGASGVVTYALGTVTLRNGSRGEAVKELQRVLNKLLNLGLVVDGKLGKKTIAVIKKWQKDHKLVVDGLVGNKTKAAMVAEASLTP